MQKYIMYWIFIDLKAYLVLKETTSPLIKMGSLPPIAPHRLLGVPPPSALGATSFMDGPLALELLNISSLLGIGV